MNKYAKIAKRNFMLRAYRDSCWLQVCEWRPYRAASILDLPSYPLIEFPKLGSSQAKDLYS
jgi:hypothetical protein